jgi:hypothetical protein
MEPYKHYRRAIVVTLYADTISLRLKGTRTAYEIPVNHYGRSLSARSTANNARETGTAESCTAVSIATLLAALGRSVQ